MPAIRKVDAGLYVILSDPPPRLAMLDAELPQPPAPDVPSAELVVAGYVDGSWKRSSEPGGAHHGPEAAPGDSPAAEPVGPAVTLSVDDPAGVELRLHLVELHGFPWLMPEPFQGLGGMVLRYGDPEMVQSLHDHFHRHPPAVPYQHHHPTVAPDDLPGGGFSQGERVEYVGLALNPNAERGDAGTTVAMSAPTPSTTKWLVRWDNGREGLYFPAELQRQAPVTST